MRKEWRSLQNAGQFEETYRKLGGNITITPIQGLGHQVHSLFLFRMK